MNAQMEAAITADREDIESTGAGKVCLGCGAELEAIGAFFPSNWCGPCEEELERVTNINEAEDRLGYSQG